MCERGRFGDDLFCLGTPYITQTQITAEHQFFILASDGLWDVMDNQTAVNFVLGELEQVACVCLPVLASPTKGCRERRHLK